MPSKTPSHGPLTAGSTAVRVFKERSKGPGSSLFGRPCRFLKMAGRMKAALLLLCLQLHIALRGEAAGEQSQIYWRDIDLEEAEGGKHRAARHDEMKSEGAIYVSVVAAGRNDDYGGSSFLDRMQPFVSTTIAFACAAFAGGTGPNFELVLVDYNTVRGVPTLADAMQWPFGCKEVAVRMASVPESVHQAIHNPSNISFFEHIAKNVGIRAARGQFVLVTNPDILLSEELFTWLAEHSLRHDTFYRIDRHDLGPLFQPPPSTTQFLSTPLGRARALLSACLAMFEQVQVSAADGIWDGLMSIDRSTYAKRLRELSAADAADAGADGCAGGAKVGTFLSESARMVSHPSMLHTMAAGDFMLMAAAEWHSLRGFPEAPTNMEVDSHMCVIAAAAGLKQAVLKPPKRIFHQHHAGHLRAIRELPERDRCLFPARAPSPL